MSNGDALLAAVLDSPDDDLPRLVYADWLEENGQERRATFIRQSIADNTLFNSNDVALYSGPTSDIADGIPPGIAWTIRHGFVEDVHGETELLLRNIQAIFQTNPIRSAAYYRGRHTGSLLITRAVDHWYLSYEVDEVHALSRSFQKRDHMLHWFYHPTTLPEDVPMTVPELPYPSPRKPSRKRPRGNKLKS